MIGHRVYLDVPVPRAYITRIALFPGHIVKFKKSELVYTVCTCVAPEVFLETSVTLVRIALCIYLYIIESHVRSQVKVTKE